SRGAVLKSFRGRANTAPLVGEQTRRSEFTEPALTPAFIADHVLECRVSDVHRYAFEHPLCEFVTDRSLRQLRESVSHESAEVALQKLSHGVPHDPVDRRPVALRAIGEARMAERDPHDLPIPLVCR